MADQAQIEAEILALRAVLGQIPSVSMAILFGSIAKGTAGQDSDIDIAIQANHPLSATERISITEAIALGCHRPVDLVDLHSVGQPLLDQIVSHGIQLIGTRHQWGDLIYRNIMDHEDFVPHQKRILEGRRRAWINNS